MNEEHSYDSSLDPISPDFDFNKAFDATINARVNEDIEFLIWLNSPEAVD